jgi:hypothetical protein
MTARYLRPANENALFAQGVTTWKLDVASTAVFRDILAQASWHPAPPDVPHPPVMDPYPVGKVSPTDQARALDTATLVLNDPVLFPGLRQLGTLTPKALELQNGAFDDTWHHDHLSNVRGHAGQFFLILYFGEPTWDPTWGGGFHYGQRYLDDNWPQTVQAPHTVHSVWPADRTALLGWNENPRMVHQAEPLTVLRKRYTFLMPVDIIPHGR